MRHALNRAALAALLVCAACGQTPSYQVSGRFTDTPDTLALMYMIYDYTRCDKVDTLVLDKEGCFGFDVDAEKYAQFMITTFNEEGQPSYDPYILMGTLPGEKLVLTGSLSDYKVSGSKYFRQMGEYMETENAVMAEMDAIVGKYRALCQEQPDKVEELSAEMQEKLVPLQDKIADFQTEFIRNHPDDEFAGYLATCSFDAEKLEESVSMLSERVRTGVMAPYIESIRKMLAEWKAFQDSLGQLEEGDNAPDFTLPKPDGSSFALASLRGKYVLLDFWGSWCKWCIKGIPALKELYNKYSRKFEIVSIACNDSDEAWRDALEKYGMPWTQVFNQETDGKAVNALYGVRAYPTFVLIDPKGTVEKIFEGESEEFVAYMTKTLK